MVSNLKIVRLPKVKEMTGLSRSSIYLRISENTFPKQINLGGRAIGFIESDIQDWINQRIDESRMEG